MGPLRRGTPLADWTRPQLLAGPGIPIPTVQMSSCSRCAGMRTRHDRDLGRPSANEDCDNVYAIKPCVQLDRDCFTSLFTHPPFSSSSLVLVLVFILILNHHHSDECCCCCWAETMTLDWVPICRPLLPCSPALAASLWVQLPCRRHRHEPRSACQSGPIIHHPSLNSQQSTKLKATGGLCM
jgi:hypothetical protein